VAPDPKLIEVARAAEAGEALPRLRIAIANQVIIGVPGSSSRFNEVAWEGISDELGRNIQRDAGTAWKGKKQDVVAERWEAEGAKLRDGWATAAFASEPDPPENLTLYGAVVWVWGQPLGFRVPALRVRLDSISTWWVGTARVMQQSVQAWAEFLTTTG
jgi:hypothetical protein